MIKTKAEIVSGDLIMQKRANIGHNHEGMVLVMVLLVLLASILIGVSAIRLATTDTRIIGNEAKYTQDIYAAESNINTAILETKSWVDNSNTAKYPYGESQNSGKNIKIVDKGRGQPPRGSGWSVTSFEANYYDITSKSGNASITAGAWKLVPKIN